MAVSIRPGSFSLSVLINFIGSVFIHGVNLSTVLYGVFCVCVCVCGFDE